ncbi:hypothetical protein SAMN05216559_3432 [Halomicrobium zhouii]|uniref:PGF-CTERM protein n=1 Tax=Halomicrobium zhouii TaxID=767519 RepID=A0A1I6LYI3_9EURY|nr:hypothetical protein [Halomicrobium zhouii]SFS08458.1 hypothetical protein SAMN05216559_3432 [Halomicrobium zhouii]
MVRFTLFEVNLDGAEFNAAAPFSGADADSATESVGETIEERLQGDAEPSGVGTSPAALFAGLVLAAGAIALGRKLLSRGRSDRSDAEATEQAPVF